MPGPYPNDQGNAASAIPVYIVSGGGAASPLTPLGYQQITPTASLATLSVPPGAKVAYILVSGADTRYRDDGINATAAIGMPVFQGQLLTYAGSLSAFNIIPQSGSMTLDILYYK